MDIIQHKINYNLIILYIKDFIQYELELEKGFSMSEKHELLELINKYNSEKKIEHYDYSFERLNYKNKKVLDIIEIEKCFEIFSTDIVKKKEEAKNKNIKKDSPVHRYYHYEKFKLNKNGGRIIYILFNPSNASPETDDSTVRNCRNLAIKDGACDMVIVNIFSERTSKPDFFSKDYIKNNQDNINFINSLIDELKNDDSNKFVKAWGFAKEKNKDYKCEIKKINFPSKIYILGIKEGAIKQNHHPSSSNWSAIGGIQYAEITPESDA